MFVGYISVVPPVVELRVIGDTGQSSGLGRAGLNRTGMVQRVPFSLLLPPELLPPIVLLPTEEA